MKPRTKEYYQTETTVRRILVVVILLLFSLLLLSAFITRDPELFSWCSGPGMALAAVYKYYFRRRTLPPYGG